MNGCAFAAFGCEPVELPESRPQADELLSIRCDQTSTGEIILTLAGELDIASAEDSFCYVCEIIDRHGRAVALDLASLSFCDARGLSALVRMSRHAKRAGCALRLIAPRPRLLEIIRITNLTSELAAG